ncbi:MAG: T9SS type A sorting domain-containing protein [Bacteroidia bacterium]
MTLNLNPSASGQTVYTLAAEATLADAAAACPGKDTLYIRLTATPSTSLTHSPLNHLQLTPNPTSQISQLSFPAGKYQITVRDITGRTLHTAQVEGSSYTLQAPSRGIFLVEVTHGTQSRTLRWVVN